MTATQASLRLHITGPAGPPEFVDLAPAEVTIGREDDNSLVLKHEQVSRHHAFIVSIASGQCSVVDLKSTNGTLVNGTRLAPETPTPLVPGTVVEIGPFKLTVERVPAPAQAVQEPVLQAPEAPPAEPARELEQQPPPLAPPASGARCSGDGSGGDNEELLPGLSLHSQRLLQYLPDIYQPPCDDGKGSAPLFSDTDYGPAGFMSRFLALFESILLPIEWTIDNFDLFLHPGTAPAAFLAWLANWFEITCDESWTEQQQRTLLSEAHEIYARRGTRWALCRMLEIYIGQPPVIVDDAADQEPYTFEVMVPVGDEPARRASIQALIDAHKPAHTMYTLTFKG